MKPLLLLLVLGSLAGCEERPIVSLNAVCESNGAFGVDMDGGMSVNAFRFFGWKDGESHTFNAYFRQGIELERGRHYLMNTDGKEACVYQQIACTSVTFEKSKP